MNDIFAEIDSFLMTWPKPIKRGQRVFPAPTEAFRQHLQECERLLRELSYYNRHPRYIDYKNKLEQRRSRIEQELRKRGE